MGLTSFFKRKTPGDAAASPGRTPPTFDVVERVRTRTRQRLIGAVALLTIGVIGFPLVFESQPRPIPVDIPIEIPPPEDASALVLPAQRREVASSPADAPAPAGVARELPSDPMTAPESSVSPAPAKPSAAGSAVASGKLEVLPGKPASAADLPVTARAQTPAAKVASEVASVRSAKVVSKAVPAVSSAPDASAASAAEGPARFVVQVGAFADPTAARELRAKMEKLGMKTYTQVAETSAGKRIRVRLGPFATRTEADRAQARSKEAGIAAVVLTL